MNFEDVEFGEIYSRPGTIDENRYYIFFKLNNDRHISLRMINSDELYFPTLSEVSIESWYSSGKDGIPYTIFYYLEKTNIQLSSGLSRRSIESIMENSYEF